MKALELKLATAMAKDLSIPLPWDLIDPLCGCGCPGFEPVAVSLRSVASFLRYQCLQFNGGWDDAEYQNCRAICLRRGLIEVSDLNQDDVREWVRSTMERVLGEGLRQAS